MWPGAEAHLELCLFMLALGRVVRVVGNQRVCFLRQWLPSSADLLPPGNERAQCCQTFLSACHSSHVFIFKRS